VARLVYRIAAEQWGQHVHARFWASGANLGELVFREGEWKVFLAMLTNGAQVTFDTSEVALLVTQEPPANAGKPGLTEAEQLDIVRRGGQQAAKRRRLEEDGGTPADRQEILELLERVLEENTCAHHNEAGPTPSKDCPICDASALLEREGRR